MRYRIRGRKGIRLLGRTYKVKKQQCKNSNGKLAGPFFPDTEKQGIEADYRKAAAVRTVKDAVKGWVHTQDL